MTSLPKKTIKWTLNKIGKRFVNNDDCPFKLIDIQGRYQLVTKKILNDDLQRYFKNTHTSILTSAALETLTIIAYNQPITRIEVDNVRGVNSSVTIERLLRQHLIKKAGHKKTLGDPIMYETTTEFLNLFGLKNIKQLPKIKK